MADVTKNSYDETNLFTKVIFQRAKDVCDYELNELQDNIRVRQSRGLLDGISFGLNPGSNDDGYKITGTGAANSVTVEAGTLFCDGLPFNNAASYSFSGFTTSGIGRTDIVYLAVTEAEVADPNVTTQLGETTLRRQLQVTMAVAEGVAIPTDDPQEIWEGGTHYFAIAEIARATGVAAINAVDVDDVRFRLPPLVLSQITHQDSQPGLDPVITGNWEVTCGDGVGTFGDFNGTDAIKQAADYLMSSPFGAAQNSAVIRVKAGTYEVTGAGSQIDLGSGLRWRIIGAGGDDTVIDNNGSGGVASITWGGIGSYVELEGVGFVNAAADSYSLDITEGSDGFKWSGCRFGHQIRVSDPSPSSEVSRASLADKCFFTTPAASGDSAVYYRWIAVGANTSRVPPVTFRDCDYYLPDGGTPLAITATNEHHITGFYFERCFVRLGATGGALSLGTISALTTIEEISFKDCDVLANAGLVDAVGTDAQLMNVVLANAGARVERLTIEGGRWLCSSASNLTTVPFYFGRATFHTGATVAAPLSELVLRDTLFGFDDIVTTARTYGAYSADVTSGAPAVGDGAAFNFVAGHVTIDNIRFNGMTNKSIEGDFYVAANAIDVKQVTIPRPYRTNAGAGTYPTSRMKFAFLNASTGATFPRYVNVERIGYVEEDIATPTQQILSAANSASVVDILGTLVTFTDFAYAPVKFDRCVFAGLYPASVCQGFLNVDGTLAGSGLSLDLSVTNCSFKNVAGGAANQGCGIYIDQDTAFAAKLNISDNQLTAIINEGIRIFSTSAADALSGTICRNNVDTIGGNGIRCKTGYDTNRSLVVNDNTVNNYGLSVAAYGINYGDVASNDTYGVVMGNKVGNGAGGHGEIRFSVAPGTNIHVRGAIPLSGRFADAFPFPDASVGADGTAMILNSAIFRDT